MGKNNRQRNSLYIGSEYMNLLGRSVKHPSLIEHYANINPSKSREDIIQLIGVDIETDYKTGEMKLSGYYEGNPRDYEENYDDSGNEIALYRYYTDDFFGNLVATIKYGIDVNKHLAYWSNLDASQIVKLFLQKVNTEEATNDVLERYKKITGEYDKSTGRWEVRPVISYDTGLFVIGIKQAIRDSIQFFIQMRGSDEIKTCWGYNIKALYMRGLEAEADYNTIQEDGSRGRFKWYSKIGEQVHLLSEEHGEWERFRTDPKFRESVLESNKLDAKAAMALGYEIQKDFNDAFKYEDETGVLNSYPTSLISQGSHARSAVACQIRNDIIREKGFKVKDILTKDHKDRKELFSLVRDKLSSIPLKTHIDKWLDKYPEEKVKDFYSMTAETYSGGCIETISYGTHKKGFIADVATAYPAVIQNLWDLTDSTLEFGEGEPPNIPYSYTFIRGIVHIPKGVDFHPITIKNASSTMKDINVRYEGDFKASYTKEERDYVISVGGSFEDETWVCVKTKGEKAVQSDVSIKLGELRNHYLSIGSRTEALIKRINNSGYGILFEATPIYEENEDGEPIRIGFRGGEFFNPLYATIITARTKIIMARASYEIEKNGGQVCVIMTDSVTWVGTKDMLPNVLKFSWGESGIKLKKTFGYFEEPEELDNLIVLGSGLYGYDIKGKSTQKRRGYNITGLLDQTGEVLDIEFNWNKVLDMMLERKTDVLKVKVRRMISVGILASEPNTYTVEDLGRVVDEFKEVSAISGKGKRLLLPQMYDPKMLSNNMMKTRALYISYNASGEGYVDGTLTDLREPMMLKELKSSNMIKKELNRKRQKRFYDRNKDDKNMVRKKNYKLARDNGFNVADSKVLMGWNKDKLVQFLQSGKTLEEYNKEEINNV